MRKCPKCRILYAGEIKYCSQDATATLKAPHDSLVSYLIDNRYELLKLTRRDAYGSAYLARHIYLKIEVVIRILQLDSVRADAGRERFLRSVRSAASLHHPNVVNITDYGYVAKDDALAFVVTPSVSGESLRELLNRSGQLNVVRALGLMLDICSGVGSAHSRSFAHGDVTPEQILITPHYRGDDRAMVSGFGIAMAVREYSHSDEHSDAFEHTNPLWPTRASALYTSPEIWDGQSPDARSDVYSLGAIFYEMLACAPPFSGDEIVTLMRKNVMEAPPPLPADLGVDRRIEAAIMRALSKNPAERQEDANALRRELLDARESYSSALLGSSGSALRRGPGNADAQRSHMMTEPLITSSEEELWRAKVQTEGQADALADRKPVYLDENVQFTVYKPRTVAPQKRYKMLAFAHLSERPPDAEPGELDPVEQVEDEARIILGERFDDYSDLTEEGSQAIQRESAITFVPVVKGIEFRPPRRRFIWQQSVHREEFYLIAAPSVEGRTVRGSLSVFLGSILLAEINLSIRVDASPGGAGQREERASARPYRKIFPSYSHEDIAIVEQIEHFAEISGDRYMRDVKELRSGENWKHWMTEKIREADIFQLFWSRKSMRSENVQAEWEYALSLARENFIRPTYWEKPMPSPPKALEDIYFYPLALPTPVNTKASQNAEAVPTKTTITAVAGDAGREEVEARRAEDEERLRAEEEARRQAELEAQRRAEETMPQFSVGQPLSQQYEHSARIEASQVARPLPSHVSYSAPSILIPLLGLILLLLLIIGGYILYRFI